MKKLEKPIPLWLMLIALSCAMTSCEKDAPNGSNTDAPLPGSITVKMRNEDNGKTRIFFSSTYILINEANNFQTNGYYSYPLSEELNIVSVGKTNGLGSIKTIPESGWTDEVSVFTGHGYVVRWRKCEWISEKDEYAYTDYSYGRIFVHEEIESTAGGILGYTVSYIEGM